MHFRSPSVDVYVTYRCDMRCPHCFVGENLNLKTDFEPLALSSLIKRCQDWNVDTVTLLGGEPTLYHDISEVVREIWRRGMKPRMVSNAGRGLSRFLDTHLGELPDFGISVDGGSAETHDRTRGPGSFDLMVQNSLRALELGASRFAIFSISRSNLHDIEQVLHLCSELRFDYLNVHYVTNRGFATDEMVLGIDDWLGVCGLIESIAEELPLEIRLERTFSPQVGFEGSCAVRDKNNLMFFPDGRVFACSMFIDIPNAHSFTWSGALNLKVNHSSVEQTLCNAEGDMNCAAMRVVNQELYSLASDRGLALTCIFQKERLDGSRRSSH